MHARYVLNDSLISERCDLKVRKTKDPPGWWQTLKKVVRVTRSKEFFNLHFQLSNFRRMLIGSLIDTKVGILSKGKMPHRPLVCQSRKKVTTKSYQACQNLNQRTTVASFQTKPSFLFSPQKDLEINKSII